MELLKQLGFKPEKSPYFNESSALKRAQDIHIGLEDNTVQAIIATHGGDLIDDVLPLLDWDLFKQYPKIIMGFSDLTPLINAIYKKTRLITFHGNDIRSGFGKHPTKYDIQEFLGRLTSNNNLYIETKTGAKTIQSGIAKGPLLGGNIRCLRKIFGTDMEPNFSESILLLEGLNLDEQVMNQYLQEYADNGIFSVISGIIIGHNHSQ